jgi:hypothetical protein
MNITIPKEEAELIVYQDHEDFEDIKGTEEITDQGRWDTSFTKVIKQLSTGQLYSIDWSKGSTECQDGQVMFYDDTVELIEVHLVEKTILVYEPICST